MTVHRSGFARALRMNWWIAVILILLAFSCLLPILNTVAISLSNQAYAATGRVGLWPVEPTLSSYRKLMAEGTFVRSFMISVIRVLLGLVLGLLTTILTAYPLSKSTKAFPLRNAYMWFLVFTMIFNAGTIPW